MPLSPSLPIILVVEDDPDMQHLYRVLLTKCFRVVVAPDGEVGLTRALEIRPALILTDQNMPICTGLEMVRRMRAIPALRHIQVLVSSAYMNPELEREFAALGVKHFLNKPCSREELLHIVSRLGQQPPSPGE
jgi:CheY-like chemotaxis protein